MHYQMLNVNPLATQTELDEGKEKMLAFIETELADKTDSGIFKKKVEEAYAILSNPTQRTQYDASLQAELFIAATFEHFERAGILYQHEQCILYESLNLSSDSSSDEVHEACARLIDREASAQNNDSHERKLKKLAVTEALLTHPLIKKNYTTYRARQLHHFSEKLAKQGAPIVGWKSYYDLLKLPQEATASEIQKAIQQEITNIHTQLKKIKTSTAPSILTLRNRRQLLENIKKLLSSQEERYTYDFFLTTLSQSLVEENAYYKLLKIYNDANKESIDTAYKKTYDNGITSLQDLKGDELLKERYISALRSTAYTILSNPVTRKNYDAWQKTYAQEKQRPHTTNLDRTATHKTIPTPLVNNKRFVLKKNGGYKQQLSPLQTRLAHAVSKRPGQASQLYKPHAARTGEEIVPTNRPAVRRLTLKKRPGSSSTSKAPKKVKQTKGKQTTVAQTNVPQKPVHIPKKGVNSLPPAKPNVAIKADKTEN